MDAVDHIFVSAAERQAGDVPTIACLYTGAVHPSSCAPMLRFPEPGIGQALDQAFADHLAAAVALNSAVHDGAVMLGRGDETSPYRITGWSYRLFPGRIVADHEPNRGSAFNSCLAMSAVPSVDRIYLITRGSIYCFKSGSGRPL